ncbi:hypothetical protein EC973_006366 [Apophysomyces ossiformis]|uniref:CUE domain-containing protein n=1 Tax=Apophysomyces ossiformis TaxID=679940 RepID=A0A8H7BTB2_9FUNG|nr:hypothetical protein EC973_006366 [Apophysomyces ossiformis]
MEQVRDLNHATENWTQKIKTWRGTLDTQMKDDVASRPVDNNQSFVMDDALVQQATKVSQVHDLFPDLGEGFIEACLAASNNDVETVIMQLLDNALPPSIASLDRSMERRPLVDGNQSLDAAKTAAHESHESVLASRRNIFDNDEFDVFARKELDKDKVHMGKKSRGTAEKMLNDKSFVTSEKSNILERIYNMYEDEYDDTYDDINEVSGRVQLQAIEGDGEGIDTVRVKKEEVDPGLLNENELVHMYVEDRELFSRSSRKSAKRAELRKRTKMSDEQLEGWAVMFDRNPRKQRILDKYMLFDVSQEQVSQATSEAQRQSRTETKRPPASPQSETRERAYREKNKARFGNHNRKKMHDKKLSKAGGQPS